MPRRSAISSARAAGQPSTRVPTREDSAGSVTPEISMVDQSMGTPWLPSEPSTSSACRTASAVVSSRSRASVAPGPPSAAQLGSSAARVVQPGVYG